MYTNQVALCLFLLVAARASQEDSEIINNLHLQAKNQDEENPDYRSQATQGDLGLASQDKTKSYANAFTEP